MRFLNIAKGSAAELRTEVCIAARVGILCNEQQSQLTVELKQISARLHALSKSIQAKATRHPKNKS